MLMMPIQECRLKKCSWRERILNSSIKYSPRMMKTPTRLCKVACKYLIDLQNTAVCPQ